MMGSRFLGAAALWLLCAAAAPAQDYAAVCRDPASGCLRGLDAECLRLGAGARSAADESACEGQLSAYADCLAYVAESCPGVEPAPALAPVGGAPAPQSGRAGLEALAPPGHRIVAESGFGGARHYYVDAGSPLGWAQAAQSAQRLGGRLVVIDSAAKNDAIFAVLVQHPELFRPEPAFLVGTFSVGPFIGLYQQPELGEPAGGWRWANGAPLSYAKWMQGQPDNFFGVEHVAGFMCLNRPTCDTWNDFKAEAETVYSYIVEIGGQ